MNMNMEEGITTENESAPRYQAWAKTWGIRAAVVFALAICALYAFHKISYAMAHESTDDAFIDGIVVPISSEVKGQVTKVMVADNQYVKQGDALLELFQEDFSRVVQTKESSLARLISEKQELQATIKAKEMGLARVRADMDAANSDTILADKDFQRAMELRKKEVISQSQYDQAEARFKSSSARNEAARAAVAETEASIEALNAQLTTQTFKIKEAEASAGLAKLDLRRTIVTAPISGRIAKKNVDVGKYIQQGQPLFSIVDESNLWIVANYKETQISHMKPGQAVDIIIDAYPGVTFKGHVDSFQPGTGAVFSLLPPQNATGNFVKVVQRVPVKILIDSKPDPFCPLWPGLSVYPSIDVSDKVR
ncbi:MAG TPA: HlyD family secretion protein [Nitrospirota bacterium]|nr:HlyD family secretion protein [Nitrospirota bacterium]